MARTGRPSPLTWLGAAALIVVVVGIIPRLVSDGDDDEGVFHPPHASAQLLRIVREGRGGVADDRELVNQMGGDAFVGPQLVEAAVCVNGLDWLRDYTLDVEIVIASDTSLVRAAELYDAAITTGDLVEATRIARVEQAYWQRDADSDRLRDWAASITDPTERDAVVDYLDERAQIPSARALDRFVIYVVQGNTRERRMYYLDTFRVSPALLRQPASNSLPSDALVSGEDGSKNIDLGDCDDLAADWDRYGSSLPELPPLEDRWELELNDTV